MTHQEPRWLALFRDLSAIPRRSGDRSKIVPWIMNWARESGFSAEKDSDDNIRIDIPATPGFENRPGIILQGHMDMVCEKAPGSDHDFSADPLSLYTDNGWLRARNTSLGADNGIALALAFDLVTDPAVSHPPLEILITSDEEIGLVGAQRLKGGFLKGKRLLNLDSEEEGVITIGCAGGRDTDLSLPVERTKGESSLFLELSVGGLAGGHSGIDIAKFRANANVLLIRLLRQSLESLPFRLCSFRGGTAHNAIPRDALAVISIPEADQDHWSRRVSEAQAMFRTEWPGEEGLTISCRPGRGAEPFSGPLTEVSTRRALALLRSLPHGVQSFSSVLPGFVETSTNLAIVTLGEESLRILTNQRSSLPSRLDALQDRITAAAELAGAKVKAGNGYPPWPPKKNSELLDLAVTIWSEMTGKPPVVEMTHAGLECGIIGDRFPGMEMISLGPDIVSPHSPDERLRLDSASRIRDYLAKLLSRL